MPVSPTKISMPPSALRNADRERAALRHRVHGIEDQMEERLAHLRGVAGEQLDARRDRAESRISRPPARAVLCHFGFARLMASSTSFFKSVGMKRSSSCRGRQK